MCDQEGEIVWKPAGNYSSDVGEDVWIFGYGSLCWKASDLNYIDSFNGSIEGYTRRFYQASEDHRGTPERPGRVVTILPKEEFCKLKGYFQCDEEAYQVFGVCYKIRNHDRERILSRLDNRERGGYTRHVVLVTEASTTVSASPRIVTAIVYRATQSNCNFDYFDEGDPRRVRQAVDRIISCVGVSGPNLQYLLGLKKYMDSIGQEDPHIERLLATINGIEAVTSEPHVQ